jgi:putative DNA-invertase from lambdoid prophage Rac
MGEDRPGETAKGAVPRSVPKGHPDGKVIGRPLSVTGEDRQAAKKLLADGATVSAVARHLKTSRATIKRLRDTMPAT